MQCSIVHTSCHPAYASSDKNLDQMSPQQVHVTTYFDTHFKTASWNGSEGKGRESGGCCMEIDPQLDGQGRVEIA